MTELLHYRADRRSLAIIGLSALALLVPYFWRPPGLMAPLWIAAGAWLCFASSIVNHNHMHCPMLHASALNRLLNLILTLVRGHTASDIIVPHNLNHHASISTDEDWIRPELSGSGLGWLRLARYVLAASVNMQLQRRRADAPQLDRRRHRGHAAERIVLACAIVLAAWYHWPVFALFNALPWLLGLALLVGVNLLQHDGCSPEVALGESRNFTGVVGNWLLLNNGYHTAHHHAPGTHWSQLPALHASLRAKLPIAGLEEPSLVAYLWRFGWSRKRQRAPRLSHG